MLSIDTNSIFYWFVIFVLLDSKDFVSTISLILLEALWGEWQWFEKPSIQKIVFKKYSWVTLTFLLRFFRLSVAISRNQAWHVLCSQLLSIGSNWEHVFISAGVIVWLITMEHLKGSIWQSYFLTTSHPIFLYNCFHLVWYFTGSCMS